MTFLDQFANFNAHQNNRLYSILMATLHFHYSNTPPCAYILVDSLGRCERELGVKVYSQIFILLTNRWWKKYSKSFCCWQRDHISWPYTSYSSSQTRCSWVSFGSVVWSAISMVKKMVIRLIHCRHTWCCSSFCRVCSETDQWQPESGRK